MIDYIITSIKLTLGRLDTPVKIISAIFASFAAVLFVSSILFSEIPAGSSYAALFIRNRITGSVMLCERSECAYLQVK